MRTFMVILMAGALIAGPAVAATVDNASTAMAQDNMAKPAKKKIKLRRTCEAGQMRCACADTGTSACCTANQTCSCQPTANCR
ncbi:MAG: hypothetical protein JO205_13645 [Pseudolabrys sp.]|nr:hypothetical protein [Pseudolabrys sp.]